MPATSAKRTKLSFFRLTVSQQAITLPMNPPQNTNPLRLQRSAMLCDTTEMK